MESSADEPQNGKELESPEKRSMEESNQSKSVTSESNHSNHSSSKDKDKQSGKRSHSSSSGSPRRRSNAETDGSLSPKKQKRRDENREKSDRNKYQQSSSERGDKIDQKHKKSHQDDKRHSPKRKETGVDRSSSQKHDDIYSPQKGSDKEQSYGEKSSTKGQKLESPDKVSTKGSKQCKSVAFENSHSTSPEVGSPRKKSRFDSSDSKFKKDDSVNLLKQDYSKDKKENFEYFFGKQSPFSNFHTAKFQVDKITYCCSEQYMMHQKAVTFKDGVHAHEIMRATDPVKMKNLGRQVKNFNADYWGRSSERILKKGVKAKFLQNGHLKKALIITFPRILVEAAPRDRLWGIGCGANNIKAHCRTTWRGKNKLGYLLTEVRNEIMEEEGYFS
ncbi:uncharacterized protein LOC125668165 isoform X2 [Ostrea edulis]|uniref:uncharacterized protein LOC125668165 isoform X2 n=1 Tax=Ostrea edulis TaxID=37623 RepID=UPI0024AFDA20|nr:uncharacterized protein LOC125668165 isoform X2 [Ostrea edulis]XP_056019133.1 uncharacterized protein LOC125668165 isoform X2 [Ostrea edulis]XP_056019134.1 uncharacterized protein LOC125668165 isoform X2 [Ostrea edulis]